MRLKHIEIDKRRLDKIKLHILALTTSQSHTDHYTLWLCTEDGRRRLPIIIGEAEAKAIAMVLESMSHPRPMTHDLMMNTLEYFQLQLKEIYISHLSEGIFYAKLIIEQHNELHDIDCRPSDGVALAVRVGAPIYCTEKILEEAGIIYTPTPEEMAAEPTEESSLEKEEMPPESDLQKKKKRLQKLHEKLSDALQHEDYEAAAKIRDQINKLQKDT